MRVRRLLILVFFLFSATAAMLAVYHLRAPVLYAGDQLEVRDCRWCGGTGKDEGLALELPGTNGRCTACGGTGKVRVIVPGKERPTRVRGAVVDAAALGELATYDSVRPQARPRPGGGLAFQRSPAAIGGAALAFRPEGREAVAEECTPYGMFHLRLAPGRYTVTVAAPGYEPLEETVEIAPLTEPIWLEEGRIVREPGSFAEAQSLYGLELLAALVREGASGRGRLRLEPGSPGAP